MFLSTKANHANNNANQSHVSSLLESGETVSQVHNADVVLVCHSFANYCDQSFFFLNNLDAKRQINSKKLIFFILPTEI